MWRVSAAPIEFPADSGRGDRYRVSLEFSNEPERAYQVNHKETNSCLGIPFRRRIDAERAATLMNERVPCNDEGDYRRVADAVVSQFGSAQECAVFLIENACAW